VNFLWHQNIKSKSDAKPRIAITIGDPAGIGTEIILKAFADDALLALDAEFTIFGDRRYLDETYNLLGNHCHLIDPDRLKIIDILTNQEISLGIGNGASGAASFAYLEAAIAQTLAGHFEAIVTAPIAKSAWKQAGHDYAGQTELLAERSQVDDF
jgi:4-hydroxythreonine-4-phosphate dehydrogenase